MKMLRYCMVIGIFLCISAKAETMIAEVSKVGCHRDSNVCFAYLRIERDIQTNCPKNDKSVRWDGTNDPNSTFIMSVLLSSQARGKRVTFGGAGESCYANFPSFRWVHSND